MTAYLDYFSNIISSLLYAYIMLKKSANMPVYAYKKQHVFQGTSACSFVSLETIFGISDQYLKFSDFK